MAVLGCVSALALPLAACDSHHPPPPIDHAAALARYDISYAGAAGRLDGLGRSDSDEQLRDWALIGLAAHLNLDTATFVHTAYDTLPVRDPGFADLARQQVGPGRLLTDGQGVVHVLVPTEDPNEARTVGLLLDQYRADHGADPARVTIDHYWLRPELDTIEMIDGSPRPTSDVRSDFGYRTMRVDSPDELAKFLATTQDLSQLTLRGSQVWASGWQWPGPPQAPVTPADVSVLQRAYPAAGGAVPPGFSLDPGPLPTADPPGLSALHAAIPDLDRDLTMKIIDDPAARQRIRGELDAALFRNARSDADLTRQGLPKDRTQLWSVSRLVDGGPVYSQARYDGGLENTDIGMTLFYTDYVAKSWVVGTGSGIPTAAVGGFVPDVQASIPWSQCEPTTDASAKSGRLWFGQNDRAFARSDDRIDLGAQATRLFTRTDGENGSEVEPSYASSRGLHFWDQNYQAIADYEPQYARLEQIMRWSGALEWLRDQGGSLPTLPADQTRSASPTFPDWYRTNNQLRERAPIPFLAPGSTGEAQALVQTPTKTYSSCSQLLIRGGVSLGDLNARIGNADYQADLPSPLRRAGLLDPDSKIDEHGDGHITEVSIGTQQRDGKPATVSEKVTRTLTTHGDQTEIRIDASPREVIPMGGVRIWRSGTTPRAMSSTVTAGDGRVSQHVTYAGHELGRLDAWATVDTVDIHWRWSLVDQARRVLQSAQDRWNAKPGPAPPAPGPDTTLTTYRDSAGQLFIKVGGPGEPWLTYGTGNHPPGADLAFRIGGPTSVTRGNLTYEQTAFAEATLTAAPKPPDDGHTWWHTVAASDHNDATSSFTPPPTNRDRTITVIDPDGRTTEVVLAGTASTGESWVPAGDRTFGPDGSAEGAALLAHLDQVIPVMAEAVKAHDGLLRGLALPDGAAALVDEHEVRLLAADDPRAARVHRIVAAAPRSTAPTLRLDGEAIVYVDAGPLSVLAGSVQRDRTLGEVLTDAGDEVAVYLHEGLRSSVTAQDGLFIADSQAQGMRVTVTAVTAVTAATHNAAARPDVLAHGGASWTRTVMVPPQALQTSLQTSTPSASPGSTPPLRPLQTLASAAPARPSPATTGPVDQPVSTVVLVCPATGEHADDCDPT
ncbi:hypothetical protein [Parafrankia elaeagni]|uniref:hypothetical protein n=1 Tax=Parafrankia elaeagni TaxID=222534 RepID=UPI0003602A89|nr:hypothetical protein [Parafrankia elaeagni]